VTDAGHTFRAKARVDAKHRSEAREEQPSADQKHERERDLRRRENAAHATSRAAGRSGASAFAQQRSNVRSRQLRDRHEPGEQSHHEGEHEHESRRLPVEADVVAAWQQLEVQGGHRSQQPPSGHEAERAADQGEQRGFGQQLTGEPRHLRA
jgi:hypothetical protein